MTYFISMTEKEIKVEAIKVPYDCIDSDVNDLISDHIWVRIGDRIDHQLWDHVYDVIVKGVFE